MRVDKKENIMKVLECLIEAQDWLWLRECARRTGLHHKTISRILNELTPFIEQYYLEPLNLRMFRIKLGYKAEDIIRILEIREKIFK